jgi:bZIP transcription factor
LIANWAAFEKAFASLSVNKNTLSFEVLTMLSFVDTDALSNAAIIAAEIVRTGGIFVVPEHQGPQAMTSKNTAHIPLEPSELSSEGERQGRISPSSYDDDESESSDSEEGEGRRVAKSRERNREHARRTRLRKKAQLEALQSRIKGLRAEADVLKQSLEECSLASILMGLSHNKKQDQITDSLLHVADKTNSETSSKDVDEIVELVGGKRKRFASPDVDENKSVSTQPLKLRINGMVRYIGGGRTQINWKTGLYTDENGVQKQLTQSQLESLRYVV